jgi:hypothetical protein
MQVLGKGVVRGATMVAFTNDAGELIEGNSLFVDVQLEAKRGGFGSRTEPMRCVDKSVVERIKHLPFPFEAEFAMEQQATKGKTTLVIVECKPLQRKAA